MKHRYIIADLPDRLWPHIFDPAAGEVMTRFAFDRQAGKLVKVLIPGGTVMTAAGKLDEWWTAGSEALRADLEDSLLNANPDSLDYPEQWGLTASDTLPEWAL